MEFHAAFRRFVVCPTVAVFLAGACIASQLAVYCVGGNSMQPTLRDRDRVLVLEQGLMCRVASGDIVIARVQSGIVIKRVVGCPGDEIMFRDGSLFRNGEEAPARSPRPAGRDMAIRLGPDEYFLLGDCRPASVDSRTFGPVRGEAILGRVLFRMNRQPELRAMATEKRSP